MCGARAGKMRSARRTLRDLARKCGRLHSAFRTSSAVRQTAQVVSACRALPAASAQDRDDAPPDQHRRIGARQRRQRPVRHDQRIARRRVEPRDERTFQRPPERPDAHHQWPNRPRRRRRRRHRHQRYRAIELRQPLCRWRSRGGGGGAIVTSGANVDFTRANPSQLHSTSPSVCTDACVAPAGMR